MSESIIHQRDKQGEWSPGIIKDSTLYSSPFNIYRIINWLLGWPGYILPLNLFFMLLSIITWYFFTPQLSNTKSFEIEWISFIYFRNLLLLLVITGALHFRLYIQKYQKINYKYNSNWLLTNHWRFLFNDQT